MFSVVIHESVSCPDFHASEMKVSLRNTEQVMQLPYQGHSLFSLDNKTKRSYNSRKQVV